MPDREEGFSRKNGWRSRNDVKRVPHQALDYHATAARIALAIPTKGVVGHGSGGRRQALDAVAEFL